MTQTEWYIFLFFWGAIMQEISRKLKLYELGEQLYERLKRRIFPPKPDPVITAIYYHEGKEFFRERYPFRRLYADNQSFVTNSVSVTVLKSELTGNEYHIHCSNKFLRRT